MTSVGRKGQAFGIDLFGRASIRNTSTMRTSKISQETSRILNAISTPRSTRSTRAATTSALRSFAHDHSSSSRSRPKREEKYFDNVEEGSSTTPSSADIEDILSSESATSRPSPRKRKRGDESPATTVVSVARESNDKLTPRKSTRRAKTETPYDEENVEVKEEDFEIEGASTPSRVKAKPKIPARKTVEEDGTVTIHPPSNWAEVYSIIQKMRESNPTAPVDTMGCEELYWPTSPEKDKRYHTLTSLMLSSQTKDTVTAAAMHRLHTELAPRPPTSSISALTVSNILSCDPKHLDNLIGKVGFHNNKTRYIKQTAEILASQYNSDVPSTAEGLMSLPGVGPKMAYLCLSAAWGIDIGIGVDVHVHRITNLWGWHKTKNPEETRAWLEGWLPKDKWHHINRMLVGLGQTVCLPVGRRCWDCDLQGTGLCKAEIRGVKVKEEKRTRTREIGIKKNDEENGVEKKEEEEIVVKAEVVDFQNEDHPREVC